MRATCVSASLPVSVGLPAWSKASYFIVEVKELPSSESAILSRKTPRPPGDQPPPFATSSKVLGGLVQ